MIYNPSHLKMQGKKNTSFNSTKNDEISKNKIKEYAIDLFNQGLNFHEIAGRLNISKIHLVRSFPKQILLGKINFLLKQGFSYEKIGEQIGIDPTTVKKYAKEGGIHRKYSDQVIRLFKNKVPISEIALRLKTQPQQIIKIIPHEQKHERLRECYIDQQLPFKDITKLLGISRTTLKNWLRQYEVMRRHANAGKEIKKYPKSEIILDYLRLNSIESIVARRGFPSTTIRRILQEANVTRTCALSNVKKHVNGVFNVPLNNYLMDVINGELLGDLSLDFRGIKSRNISNEEYKKAISNLRELQTSIPKDLAEVVDRFNDSLEAISCYSMSRIHLCASVLAIPWILHLKHLFKINSVPLSSHIDNAKITARKYHNISLWSGFTTQFREVYDLWYPESIKVVPREVQMTPNTLLHWYIGDGSANSEILFSTHNFKVDDVIFLVDEMNKTLGIDSHWRFQKRKRKTNQPVIIIGRREDIQRFYQYLEKATPETLRLAKKTFPWKFSRKIRKRDVMKSESYRSELISNLHEYENLRSLLLETINKYYPV
ncbi:hypothetical protein CEE45_01335 [Candidatus Heimdallarchaeota archaeon B3_Heim]|nr:MAG: hypothetical protein CEE45_01335 [Candidatus Heimdallarchaeota archaeon B3_Heim]